MSLKIINPANQQLVKEIETDTEVTITTKFRQAQEAQKKWQTVPLAKKIEFMLAFRGILDSRKNELASILTSEVGKPIKQSLNEIIGLLTRIDFFVKEAEATIQTENVFQDSGAKMREQIEHEALGVIVNISAWNYPYFVGGNVFVPALLTGNAVMYKPSEFCALTGIEIGRALHDAGIPKDLFSVVIGAGEVGAQLLKLPMNGVFFTGSFATGKKITEAVASKMIKLQLELGGKDPSYIAEDADVKNAAESTSDGAMYNTGQSCCSVERIYVHKKIAKQFIEEFVKSVKTFKVGPPTQEDTYIGPLTRSAQLKVLEDQVADAVKKGATILTGGKRIPGAGNYFEPTVVTNVNSTMAIMSEESFGPIIGIQEVADDVEALKLMNANPYGLTAGVYSASEQKAKTLLSQVNAGSVYWNCCDRVSPRLPWAGRGHSGIGLTLSTHGILAFTQTKAWHLKG